MNRRLVVICPNCDMALWVTLDGKEKHIGGFNCECGTRITFEVSIAYGEPTSAFKAYIQEAQRVRRNS